MFTVLIPARLGSTRLPNKPLADIAGLPMVVRVARQAARSKAARVSVATDSALVRDVCTQHQIECVMTDSTHASGSDRLAQAAALLGLDTHSIVVNVQGDEPLVPPSLIDAVAQCLQERPDCAMSTVAQPITEAQDFSNPNVVKVVCDAKNTALYFSRATIPFDRDGTGAAPPLRHVGLYAYRVDFLRRFPQLPRSPIEQSEALEQLRALWHGQRIALHVTPQGGAPGVDTPEDLERVRALFVSSAML